MILLLAILVVVFADLDPSTTVAVLVVACIAEVGEIVLLRRWAKRLDRRTAPTTGAKAMIGERAEVVEACRPNGTVHIHGELWEARCSTGADAGETVRVEAVDGLVLVVGR
jgi:membrane protein implicated in regulation of membrane protease activity